MAARSLTGSNYFSRPLVITGGFETECPVDWKAGLQESLLLRSRTAAWESLVLVINVTYDGIDQATE